MEVFRLSAARWSGLLSGKGASLNGARWNSPGTELIYTAANRSLAMAEVAVHFSVACMPDDYRMVTIYVPDMIKMLTINERQLPDGWNNFPYETGTRKFGDDFIRSNKFCLLRTPSAVTKGDFNILINPFHGDFKTIRIIRNEPFPLDRRLFK